MSERIIVVAAILAATGLVGQILGQEPPEARWDMTKVRKVILERAERLKEFAGQTIPEATDGIMREANKIAGGTLSFAGSDVKVGLKDIDWSGGHIKHQNWKSRLNRFTYLRPLASAWRKTHDERYARAARAYIEGWLDYCGSYEDNKALPAGDNTLSIAERLGNSEHAGWGGVLPAFVDSKAFDDAFVRRMLESISNQAGYLEHHLAGSGNWRIVQVGSLVFTGLRFPFLENADEMLKVGYDDIRKTLPSQFLADGVHIERTPGYHAWMTNTAMDYWRLGKLMPALKIPLDRERLAKAEDYMVQSALSALNDSHITLKDPAEIPNQKHRERVLKELYPGKTVKMPPLEQVFRNAGQVFVRGSWKPGSEYLSFDCGKWGGQHSHMSRLGLTYRSGGRLLVADPGIITYEATDPMGPYGKSTPAHSTLNVNGLTQSEADAELLRTEFTPETAFLYGQYAGGYWSGAYTWGWDPPRGAGVFGKHRRIVFQVRGEYVLVLDEMLTDAQNRINNVWQMAPMEKWEKDEGTLSWHSMNKGTNLLVRMVSAPDGTEMKVFEGSREPLAGWVGGNGKDAVAAPQVRFSYPGVKWNAHPVTSTVLLVPFQGEKAPDYRVVEVQGSMEKYYHTVVLQLPDGRQDLISWTQHLEVPVNTLSEKHKLSTDAPFVWLRYDADGRPTNSFLLDGSYLSVGEESLLSGKEQKAQMVKFKQRGRAGRKPPE